MQCPPSAPAHAQTGLRKGYRQEAMARQLSSGNCYLVASHRLYVCGLEPNIAFERLWLVHARPHTPSILGV
eukprot:s546_g8.t1